MAPGADMSPSVDDLFVLSLLQHHVCLHELQILNSGNSVSVDLLQGPLDRWTGAASPVPLHCVSEPQLSGQQQV